MKIILNKFRAQKYAFTAIFEVLCGGILLIYEIREFIRLPTTIEADKIWGGTIDLFKYQENTYSLLYLWSLLIIAGISYWVSLKMH